MAERMTFLQKLKEAACKKPENGDGHNVSTNSGQEGNNVENDINYINTSHTSTAYIQENKYLSGNNIDENRSTERQRSLCTSSCSSSSSSSSSNSDSSSSSDSNDSEVVAEGESDSKESDNIAYLNDRGTKDLQKDFNYNSTEKGTTENSEQPLECNINNKLENALPEGVSKYTKECTSQRSVNVKTKAKTELDSNNDKIEIGSEARQIDLIDIYPENGEDKGEKDFSSDDSIADPNYHVENDDSSSDSDETVEEIPLLEAEHKLTRKRKAKPELWKNNVAKRLRNAGKEYIGKNNKLIRERRLGPPCSEKCKLECNTKFDNATRQNIFDAYYKLSDLQSKRQFVAFNMSAIVPTYQYKRGTRRNNNAFYLTDKEGAEIRVCKTFFMSTLDISDRCIRTVSEKTKNNIGGIITADLRGKHGNHSSVDNHLKDGVRNFIKSIPKVESHYCRADTQKEYIDGSKTIAEIHRDYVNKCDEKREASVNYIMFNRIFNTEFNISFYQPKKDQCEDCVAYSNATEEVKNQLRPKYDDHLKEKELSRTEKAKDKKQAENEDSTIVAVYDLQAVMPCPRGDVSNFYYVSKLNTFNFTIYEMNTKNVHCYVWHEGEANRGATEIGTCVFKYLENLGQGLAAGAKKIDVILYSDSCCGQQKNRFIISMYMYAVTTFDHINTITHKFLIKGHTQNEGDSVHSVIERSIHKNLKSGPIYTPDQYISIIRTAKKKGTPYKVHEMDHKSFYDLKYLASDVGKNFNKNTNNDTVKMTDIKILKVDSEHKGFFFYKTSYNQNDFESVKVVGRTSKSLDQNYKKLQNAYKKSNGISEKKKKGLVALVDKNIIPNYYRQFYEGL